MFTVTHADSTVKDGGDPSKSFVSHRLLLQFPSRKDYTDLLQHVKTREAWSAEDDPLKGPRPALGTFDTRARRAALSYFEIFPPAPVPLPTPMARGKMLEILWMLGLFLAQDNTVMVPQRETPRPRSRLAPIEGPPAICRLSPVTSAGSGGSNPASPHTLAASAPCLVGPQTPLSPWNLRAAMASPVPGAAAPSRLAPHGAAPAASPRFNPT